MNNSQQQAKENLQKIIDQYGLQDQLDIDDLANQVYESEISDNMRIMRHILELCEDKFESEDDFQNVAQVWAEFWNNMPHKALGGKTPREVSSMP